MKRSTKAVWKFTLDLADSQTVQLPVGAQVLTVQMQGQTLCLWALCEQGETAYEPRTFAIHGTGHPVYDAPLKYIGTVQVASGRLIFHVFEVGALALPKEAPDGTD